MIKLNSSEMLNAITRAKAVRPLVVRVVDRVYNVTNHRVVTYTVRFAVAGKIKLGSSDCQPGVNGRVCYHIAAATALNIATHSNYSPQSSRPFMAGVLVKTAGSSVVIDSWDV